MKVLEILFDRPAQHPETNMFERQILIKSTWVSEVTSCGVSVAVPGRPLVLYPFTNILRVKCEQEVLEFKTKGVKNAAG